MPDSGSEETIAYIADMLDQLRKLAEPLGDDLLVECLAFAAKLARRQS